MNCLLIWAVGLNCKIEFVFYGLFFMKHFKFVFTHQSQVSPAEILNKLASSSIQENWISISCRQNSPLVKYLNAKRSALCFCVVVKSRNTVI